jgi:aryl-alcohol dehydrogenase-like predicted oxidoreductase
MRYRTLLDENSTNTVVHASLDAGITLFRHRRHVRRVRWDRQRARRRRTAVGALSALPAVGSVICGAMTPGQVTANAAADWIPSAADLAVLDAIVALGERVV